MRSGIRGFEIRPASPADNPQLLELLGSTPIVTPSESYRLERQPDAFAFQALQGSHSLLLVAVSHQLIQGLISLVFDRVWLDGQPTEVLYTSDLRVHPRARGMGLGEALMREGVALAQARCGSELPIFTCVSTENPVGLRMNRYLSDAGMATMDPLGQLITGFWPCQLAGLWPETRKAQYRRAHPEDYPAMSALWEEVSSKRQLARAYQNEEWGSSRRFPPASWILAQSGHQLLGFVGVWDQRQMRQVRLLQPGPMTRLLSGWQANQALPLAHCLHLCLRPEARLLLPGLLKQALQVARSQGARLLSLALDAQDPLSQRLPRHLGSLSRMHLLGSVRPQKNLPYHLEMALG
jgi:ribosomal protein S18 acetylase RimI-like enzyme